jgi:phosphoribosylglycinamide formyltransferase-1
MNVHPALLPAFPGLDAQKAPWEHGARSRERRCTSSTTTRPRPIVVQAAVPVLEEDTPDTLAARILVEEHLIYPKAVRLFFEGKLRSRAGA